METSKKAPAFQWYAADYLADERVMLLSLESEAVYVRLLSYCWREGSIPAKPELCVPMCKYADIKVIKPALALFIKSPTQSGRLIHKRLEEERGKQEAFRVRQAENGRRGGRPRKPTDNPEETQEKGLGFSGESQTKPKKSSSFSSSSSTSNNSSSFQSEEPPLSGEVAEYSSLATSTEEVEVLPPSESPGPELRTLGGAADVPTRVAPVKPKAAAKVLMRDSPMADFAAFVEAFEALQDARFVGVDLVHYHTALLDWSNANGEKKADWLATIRGSMRRDADANRLRRLGIPPLSTAPALTVHRNPHNAGLGSGGGQVSQVAARTQQAHNMMNAYEYDSQGNRIGRRV